MEDFVSKLRREIKYLPLQRNSKQTQLKTSQQLCGPPLEPAVVVPSAHLLFGGEKKQLPESFLRPPQSRTSDALILICVLQLSLSSCGGGGDEVLQWRAHFILCARSPTWQPEHHRAAAGRIPHWPAEASGIEPSAGREGREGGRERARRKRGSPACHSLCSAQGSSRHRLIAVATIRSA